MALGVRVRDIALPTVDRRMVIGAILAAVAALGVLMLTKPPERIPVLVAGSDLAFIKALRPLFVNCGCHSKRVTPVGLYLSGVPVPSDRQRIQAGVR